ncbi:hypothetical protein V5799_013738, partial [Amblyomma americanum]
PHVLISIYAAGHSVQTLPCHCRIATVRPAIILASMPHTATVYASIEDPTLPCATALRTELDLPEKTATYLVHLKGLNGTEDQFVTYDYSMATPDVPNKAALVVDKDYSNPLTIAVLFTDYQTCFVGILPFGDQAEQCMLWVEVEYLERIPQRCNDAFANSIRIPKNVERKKNTRHQISGHKGEEAPRHKLTYGLHKEGKTAILKSFRPEKALLEETVDQKWRKHVTLAKPSTKPRESF